MRLTSLLAVAFSAVMLPINAMSANLTYGSAQEPSSVDPHYHNMGPNNGMAMHIFGSLVGSDENQQHVPDLAVSWKIGRAHV